ncbi:MAG: hypothetical protein H6Q60_1193 [Oscillospiraceae bacterium]|nr:hypothetical protein [Oscillospiraceae bacterium]
MFQGFTNETIDFMWNIRFNNERSWFEAHKETYKTVLERPMKELAQSVHSEFSSSHTDLDVRLHVSRIYRDARRLHGNGPYKDHLWFTLQGHDESWTDKPVFWFELTPEHWSYGLGYYLAKPLTMAKLRARIDRDSKPLTKLAKALERQGEFVLDGECYSKPKCGPEHPLSHWYNKKSFSLIHEEKVGDALFSTDLEPRLVEGFSLLLPCYRYFSTLDGDPDPRG